MGQYNNTKRSLRPRTEVKNYVETTDIVVVSDTDEYKQNGYMNGYDYSDSDEGELPPLPPIKVCVLIFFVVLQVLSLEIMYITF